MLIHRSPFVFEQTVTIKLVSSDIKKEFGPREQTTLYCKIF